MVLEAIQYVPGRLKVLDQLKLPHQLEYEPVRTVEDAWSAIKDMRVRGAPAIAIVAALGLAVELANMPDQYKNALDAEAMRKTVHEKLDYLVTSRPTAVNLGGAAKILKVVVDETAKQSGSQGLTVLDAYVKAAEQMLKDDVKDNENIGKHGSAWIKQNSPRAQSGPISIVTHCNTGSLATAGYGTALGVIRSVHADGNLKHAFCTETRPYNQGSRLTAFELVHDKIPATLVTDSMASALLRLKGDSENIAAIVVGADRVAANGDTANKIGTYNLAITARHHGVKFLVAAPRTTIDLGTASGADIKIEERAGHELTTVSGPVVKDGKLDLVGPAERISIAADGIGVWNPAFDVTPAELIDGIITEVGVAEKDVSGAFQLKEIMTK
ncbi:hypothetical protein FH972_021069 [Carpinus fangiana]|uniref:Methylthioribose-1-phosphate isomerase n=1 Tax=Carpinus fangiana TaxID=176857 RepID=A0A5N6KNW2_9ROSI|nr:hypothetical protein FH972_021069 [Carpinus fangiana]